MSEEGSKKPTVECRPNGPYLVKNLPELRNSSGDPLEHKAVYALCRCGASANKPFCDGTHAKIGFSGARERDDTDPAVDAYPGAAGTITDSRPTCAHTGFCTDDLPAVFRTDREPWIDPDGADPGAIRDAVRRCPSGALAWQAKGEAGPEVAPGGPPGITVLRNGPYAVTGVSALVDETTGQRPYNSAQYALCRCGQSKNKPFCDGSHWDAGFQDDRN